MKPIDSVVHLSEGIKIKKILLIGHFYLLKNYVKNTASCGKHDA